MDLSISVSTNSNGVCVLELDGALDLASRHLLTDAAAAGLADPATIGLSIDMANVTFFDSSGVGALVQLAADCEDSNRSFALQSPSTRVQRVLDIAGLTDAWPTENR